MVPQFSVSNPCLTASYVARRQSRTREREDLRSRFDALVPRLRDLSASGEPRLFGVAAPIFGEAQSLLKRLDELSERFEALLVRLQSMNATSKASRGLRGLRFWDHG